MLVSVVFAPAPLPVVGRLSLFISGWLRSVRPNACDGLITLMLWLAGEFLHSAVIAASGDRPDFPKMVFSLVPFGSPGVPFGLAHRLSADTERSLRGGVLFGCVKRFRLGSAIILSDIVNVKGKAQKN